MKDLAVVSGNAKDRRGVGYTVAARATAAPSLPAQAYMQVEQISAQHHHHHHHHHRHF